VKQSSKSEGNYKDTQAVLHHYNPENSNRRRWCSYARVMKMKSDKPLSFYGLEFANKATTTV
jgi:hypothetical protein